MLPKSAPVAGVLESVSLRTRVIAPPVAVTVASPCFRLPESVPAVTGTGWIRTAWTRRVQHVLAVAGRFIGGGRTSQVTGRLTLPQSNKPRQVTRRQISKDPKIARYMLEEL